MQKYIFLQVHLQQQAGKPQNNYTKVNWNNLKRTLKNYWLLCVIKASVQSQGDT